jgi:sterol desaturase/sphingolipid hydroxylase (fatty acid hydroxylase superfamily)
MSSSTIVLLHVAGILAVLERIPRLRRIPSPFLRPHVLTDVAFFVVSWAALAGVSLLAFAWASNGVRSSIGSLVGAAPWWAQVVASIVLLDLGNYLAHRLLHRSDTLWRFHEVHHSLPMLDWLATFRQHVVEQVVRRSVAPLVLVALGMPVNAAAVAAAVLLSWGVFSHSNLGIDLRFLEPLFITPRLHHLHHVPSSAVRNFGTFLSVWDRAFGTLDTRAVDPRTPLGAPGGRADYPQTFGALMLAPLARPR